MNQYFLLFNQSWYCCVWLIFDEVKYSTKAICSDCTFRALHMEGKYHDQKIRKKFSLSRNCIIDSHWHGTRWSAASMKPEKKPQETVMKNTSCLYNYNVSFNNPPRMTKIWIKSRRMTKKLDKSCVNELKLDKSWVND